jgi:uncharacterized protein YggE
MRIVHLALVAAGLAVAVAFAGVGRPDTARGSAPDTRSVTVTGTASVQAVPNRAGFAAGVSSNAATAQAALAANATKAARIVEALRSAGVAKAELQTQDVSVSPRWNEHGEQDGFTGHSSLQVHVRDVRAAGRLIDAAVAAGASETYGPSLERGDREALYRSALKRAFADARLKAATLAGEAGASLGPVLRIEDGPSLPQPEPMPLDMRAAAEMPTPVEPGKQEVHATVTVAFGLVG